MKSTYSVAEAFPTPRNKEQGSLNILDPRRNSENTESTAKRLVEYLNAPSYYEGFLKMAWRLDDTTIFRLAGIAKERGKNPATYFMVCARNEVSKRAL